MAGSVMESISVASAQQVHELLSKFIESTDCSTMSEEALAQHRKDMAMVQSKAQEGLSKTARKELNFDDQEIRDYIDWVLQRGFELVATNPGDAPKMNDAQTVKRYKLLIEERVQVSQFGENNFKIAELRVQRKSIEESENLHDLRQNIKAMIPVLKMYREFEALRTDYKKIMDFTDEWVPVQVHDQVLLELEAVKKLSDARKHAIDTIIDDLYRPVDEMSDEELLQAVDAFKLMHQCNDDEAAKFYGTNRTKISRLRAKANRQLH